MIGFSEDAFEVVVRDRIVVAENVISIDLVDPAGLELAEWSAGAHIDVLLPSGLIRQYSLCGDYEDRTYYRIAVLLDPESRGGSREIHETTLPGTSLRIRGPRNHFELMDADSYFFVAGGIGVTPILTMVRRADQLGKPWYMIYGGRTLSSMAFLDDLLALGAENIEVVPQDEKGYPDIEGVVRDLHRTAVYACGPPGLLNVVIDCCDHHLGPKSAHIERFGAGAPLEIDERDNSAFELELRRSGITVIVEPDETMLNAITKVLPNYLYSCEEGYCGTCIAAVLEGIPQHRDTCLMDDEHEGNELVITCISRSETPKLVLDV